MRLIGINGFKRVGKDTTGAIIASTVQARGETAARRAFADKLKVMAARALGYEGRDQFLIEMMDVLKESGYVDSTIASGIGRHLTGREYLQLFGQKARETFGDSFWVDQVLPAPRYDLELPGMFSDAGLGYITDVRYPNEAKRIIELGGQVWEVQRPGTASDGHSSEQRLPQALVTHWIDNCGTISDLEQIVVGLLG